MNRYLLDTNAYIAWLKNRETIVRRVETAGRANMLLCPPVKMELWFGACKSERKVENQKVLREFFAALALAEFNDEVMVHYGEIRAELERRGSPIGPMDLLIAAFACAHGLTIVTRNQGEFSRVPGLDVENWEIDSIGDS